MRVLTSLPGDSNACMAEVKHYCFKDLDSSEANPKITQDVFGSVTIGAQDSQVTWILK